MRTVGPPRHLTTKHRYDLGYSVRDRHPACAKLADRSALGGSPFKTEEKRTKGDVKEERSHLRPMHAPRKLREASSAALSAPAQFRHLFPFIFFLLASFLPPFLPLWVPWPLTTLRRCLALQKLPRAEEIPRSGRWAEVLTGRRVGEKWPPPVSCRFLLRLLLRPRTSPLPGSAGRVRLSGEELSQYLRDGAHTRVHSIWPPRGSPWGQVPGSLLTWTRSSHTLPHRGAFLKPSLWKWPHPLKVSTTLALCVSWLPAP